MPPKRKAQPKTVSKTSDEVSVKPQRGAKQTKVVATANDEEDEEEEVPVKRQRKAKQTKEPKANDTSEEEPVKKQRRGTKKTTNEETKPVKAAPLNITDTKWEAIDFSCDKKNPKDQNHNLKITSWNVDGLRAWLKKGGLNILSHDKPDIFCIQETKCSMDKLPEEIMEIEGYQNYWCSSDKEGYAGVGVFSKVEPLNVTYGIGSKKHDEEGRCITLEYKTFYLVNVYVPNAGRGLVTLDKRLEWNDSFKAFIKKLDKTKPVILCGDMNVAHNEIDLTNPKSNKKNAGFTPEEREGMSKFLEDGYIDTFRKLYPEETGVYTFWSYMAKARSKNVGWRLDYFIVSKRIMDNICDTTVRKEVFGSDHCPISLFINI